MTLNAVVFFLTASIISVTWVECLVILALPMSIVILANVITPCVSLWLKVKVALVQIANQVYFAIKEIALNFCLLVPIVWQLRCST